jgi:hypothetical protein
MSGYQELGSRYFISTGIINIYQIMPWCSVQPGGSGGGTNDGNGGAPGGKLDMVGFTARGQKTNVRLGQARE